jgi:hypothetical protein
MLLTNFKSFIGQHCETTALGALLKNVGLNFSEPMLFGLGQGLGFIYWDSKSMDFPFIGGRSKPDAITRIFCGALNIPVQFSQTTSARTAWQQVTSALEAQQPIGLKVDCYYLDYFSSKVHFAAHYLALYGFDDTYAYVCDTEQQGTLAKTRLTSLADARKARGPMSSPSLSFTLQNPGKLPDLKTCIQHAIRQNAKTFLTPPIQNIGYKGILKMSRLVKTWFERSRNKQKDFSLCAALMERGGTGGSLFRKLYAAFLSEASQYPGLDAYAQAALEYQHIAELWSTAAQLIKQAGQTEKAEHLEALAKVLEKIAHLEKSVMEQLAKI